MAGLPSYRHGRIVWAYLRSSHTAKRETHPAIILDRDEDIIQPEYFDPRKSDGENIVHVIGVSTKHRRYQTPFVPLPFSSQGHAVTHLKQDCGAIIGWYARLSIPDDVIGFGGDVPRSTMMQINSAVREDLIKLLGKQLDSVRSMFEELLGDVD